MLEFHGTLVQILIGALFVLISASVSPSDVNAVLPAALALVAIMVLVIRPLAVALATWRSGLSLRERAFVAWMAPRGIVAGATASAFGLELEQAHVPGAQHILPIVFVAIFATVVIYGLTAAPVARLLGVAEASGRVVLVVGGTPWARAIAASLKGAGFGVRLWSGRAVDQEAARAVGLTAERGKMMLDAISRETELEDVTDALLLTGNDDFNALAALALRTELGHGRVYRAAPDLDETDLLAPAGEKGILGTDMLDLGRAGPALRGGCPARRGPGQRRGVRRGCRALRGERGRRPARRLRRQAAAREGRRPGHRAGGGR